MAVFETLLHRFCTQPNVIDLPLELQAFAKRTGPALENAWFAWAKAYAAMETGHPHRAHAWLTSGRAAQREASDPVLDAEFYSAVARVWIAVDEPHSARGPAEVAWQKWFALATKPRADVIAPPARVLMKVLSEPHPAPRLKDEDVFHAWLLDRLTLAFAAAARELMSVFADFGDLEKAEEVSRDFLGWVDRYAVPSAGPQMAGFLSAGFLIALGDVYDRCDDSERAIAVLEEGLARLKGLPEINEIVSKRAQLRFNLANQFGKNGRLEESLQAFELAHEDISKTGSPEAILRSRYALCFARYKLGRNAGLEADVIDLAGEYEKVLKKAQPGSQQLAARQMLDKAYRMWLRLCVPHLDLDNVGEVHHLLDQLFALKEEEGRLVEMWNDARRRDAATVVSEVTVMIERVDRLPGTAIVVIEQIIDALLFVSYRAGEGPWHKRLHMQLIEGDDVSAMTDLLLEHRYVVDHLGTREVGIKGAPSERFANACARAWSVLSETIRQDMSSAETLMVSLDNQTELDELPVELFHDGTSYLGLRADVVRAPALRDLNILLGDNCTNAASTGSALVVRAEDDLSEADDETQAVAQSLERLGLTPGVRPAPDTSALLDELSSGVDLLHFVGHGLADVVGEALPLGKGRALTARDVEALSPAPAPATILSACLAGRERQVRTGELRGFGTQLLRQGAPVVVAAKYFVPDLIATEYTKRLYPFLQKDPIARAIRATRKSLADDGYHPAVWSCFVVFGRPLARIPGPHASDARSWTSAVVRYLATGSDAYLNLARDLLEQDRRVPPEPRLAIRNDLDNLARRSSKHFRPKILSDSLGLDAFPEAMIAGQLVRLFGVLRHGLGKATKKRDELTRQLISQVLLLQRVLGDTYLLVAIAVEISKDFLHLHGVGRDIAQRASRQVRWISAEGNTLAEARSILDTEEK